MSSLSILTHTIFKPTLAFCVMILWGCLSAVTASAQVQPVISLTINGGASAAIVNGQSITLEWYVVGATNCSINNGVGAINTSASTTGSVTVIPPNNLATDYVLTCSSGSSVAEVEIRPTVSLTSQTGSAISGNVRQATGSALTGLVSVQLGWQSEYATQCTNISFVREGETLVRWASNAQNRFPDIGKTEGRITFGGWPNDAISTTTTFFITCRNALTGANDTDQITIRVLAPLPPPELTLIATTSRTSVSQSTSTGQATANVNYVSTGATGCTFSAFNLAGNPITVNNFSNRWSGHLSGNLNVGISTSTQFQIRCQRGAVGVYPATSTTRSVIVEIQNAGGAIITPANLPVPTLSAITATPESVTLDAITGQASTRLSYVTQHTTSCQARAYQLNGVEYDVSNWTGWLTGNINRLVTIATSTRFTVNCVRSFDNATTSAQFVIVSATPAVVVVNEPKTYMYANAVQYRARDMIRLQTSGSFVELSNTHALGGSILSSATSGATPPVSITFPFNPPIASSTGLFDIQLRYCDESDGSAQYTISTQSNGVVGTWVSDAGTPQNSSTVCDTTSFVTNLVAENLALTPGELITLSCAPLSGTAETCRVDTMYVGMPDEVTVNLPPAMSVVTIPLLWLSRNSNSCPFNEARAAAGNYRFAFSVGTQHYRTNAIATSTSFAVRCEQSGGQQLSDSSSVKVNVLPNPDVTVLVGVVSGDCIDPVSSLARTSEPWETVAGNGQCQLAVDLLAGSPIVNQSAMTSNAQTGQYANVQVGNIIANAGPGAVPPGESISYQTTIYLQGGEERTSPIQYFTGGINAPVGGTPSQSGAQVTTFADIPFGSHRICTTINADASQLFPESNLDVTNNTSCTNLGFTVPEPNMSLTTDKVIVRRGQTVDLSASVPVTYGMSCRINGTGITAPDFITPAQTSSEIESLGIFNASVYQLSCTESTTNTVFVREVLVEVVPTFEER